MNKCKVFVKKVYVGYHFLEYATISEVKDYLDRLSNDHISMLYQGCTAKFISEYEYGEDKPDLYLMFERLETDEEYQHRVKMNKKELEEQKDKKYKEYLKLKEEFEGKPE
jgi:hypothetical protein